MQTNRVDHAIIKLREVHAAKRDFSAAKNAYQSVQTAGRKFFVQKRREDFLRAHLAYRAAIVRLTEAELATFTKLTENLQ